MLRALQLITYVHTCQLTAIFKVTGLATFFFQLLQKKNVEYMGINDAAFYASDSLLSPNYVKVLKET